MTNKIEWKWEVGGELCNSGLCKKMNELIESGMSQRKASKILADEAKRKYGIELYTSNSIRMRYGLHTGKRNPNKINKKCNCQPDFQGCSWL